MMGHVTPPPPADRENFRRHVQKLRLATGLSVDQLQRRLESATPPFYGSLSRYLHETGRSFPPALVDALDTVFAEIIPAYTPGSLRQQYHQAEKPPSTDQPTEHPPAVQHSQPTPDPNGHRQTPADRAAAGGLVPPARLGRRLTTVLVTILAVTITAILGFWLWTNQPTRVVSGTLSCQSGQPITAVFVKIDWMPDGVWARTRPDPQHPTGTIYNADVPAALPYALHVGCGGTATAWTVEARTPKTTATVANYVCDDQPDHLTVPPFLGTCQPD